MIWRAGIKFRWNDTGVIRTITKVDADSIYYNPKYEVSVLKSVINNSLKRGMLTIINESKITIDLLEVLGDE